MSHTTFPVARDRWDDAAQIVAGLEELLSARCGLCGGPVPSPGLYVVQRLEGPVEACDAECGAALDDDTDDLDDTAATARAIGVDFLSFRAAVLAELLASRARCRAGSIPPDPIPTPKEISTP